jgi:hypothetical protein
MYVCPEMLIHFRFGKLLHYPYAGLPKREIKEHIEMQGDIGMWTTKEGYPPFPKPMETSS